MVIGITKFSNLYYYPSNITIQSIEVIITNDVALIDNDDKDCK